MTITTEAPIISSDDIAETDKLTEFAARLDNAVAGIRDLDPVSHEVAQEFALALDSLSRAALTTIVRRLKADERGAELLFELVDDPAVRMLFGMYGIIRLPDPEQAERASAGTGADGAHAAPAKSARAFISLDSMLRGPASQQDHSCGTGGCGPDSCVCGEH
jgi:hypothetical protein